MFEAAEVARKLSKADYNAQVPRRRGELLDAQRDLRAADQTSSAPSASMVVVINWEELKQRVPTN